MGKLITIVGNSGVGKTTLTQALCQQAGYVTGIEEPAERPFQYQFARDLHRYALANQIDFLLFRANQERELRQFEETAVQDGGLDQDFYIFTRHFHERAYLSTAEFALCQQLHTTLRQLLPPPDLIIWLQAPLDTIATRYRQRGRPLEITQLGDLAQLEQLMMSWLSLETAIPILQIDARHADYLARAQLEALQQQIEHMITAVPTH
ncbi:MAG: deoxynucleoside kinase [Chloroflexota bacterium]